MPEEFVEGQDYVKVVVAVSKRDWERNSREQLDNLFRVMAENTLDALQHAAEQAWGEKPA